MKLLLFVDTHGSISAFKKIASLSKKEKPDLLICAGDFTIFEHEMELVLSMFNGLGIPLLITHGNHEDKLRTKKLCHQFSNLIFLHKDVYIKDDVLFVTYGGGGFDRETPGLKSFIKKSMSKINNFEKVVFITHQPPFGTVLDKIARNHCGNITIREAIDTIKPVLAISGHLHENARKQEKLGKTLLINPGPFGKVIEI